MLASYRDAPGSSLAGVISCGSVVYVASRASYCKSARFFYPADRLVDRNPPGTGSPAVREAQGRRRERRVTIDRRPETASRGQDGAGAAVLRAPSDEDLLARIATAEDRAAFIEVFKRFSGRVQAFLVRGGASPEEAEDATQDVMVQVWRRAGSFDPSRAGASTWIYTIARNKRIDMVRRQRRPEPDPTDPLFSPDPEPQPDQQLAGAERDDRVRQALGTLPEDQRDVVRLAFFAGLTHGEIADRLQSPLGTVKSRLRLAFGRMRADLGDDFQLELSDD